MTEPQFILTVDAGGTRTKMGLVNRSTGALLHVAVHPSPFSGTDEFLALLSQTASALLSQAQAGWNAITAIGIGLPGYVDGNFISQVWESMAYMEGDQFRPTLEQAFHLPVLIENDARAIALAEYHYGGGCQPERLLSLTLGTGIGFGFILNGSFHEKKPLAHMAPHILIRPGAEPCYCGLNGCLESLVNGRHLLSEFQRRRQPDTEPDLADSKEILHEAAMQAATARAGSAFSAVQELLQDLITGLNIFIYTYAPDEIVLGGGVAQGLAEFLPQIQQGLIAQPYRGFHSQVRISALGEKAGLLGAAALFKNPA